MTRLFESQQCHLHNRSEIRKRNLFWQSDIAQCHCQFVFFVFRLFSYGSAWINCNIVRLRYETMKTDHLLFHFIHNEQFFFNLYGIFSASEFQTDLNGKNVFE